MGRSKKFNMLAAQLRIIQRGLAIKDGVPLQQRSLALHQLNCQLLQYNVHFPSHAADLARPQLTSAHFAWAKRVHKKAALERHEVFVSGPIHAPTNKPILVEFPSGALECSDLEKTLRLKYADAELEHKLKDHLPGPCVPHHFKWNTSATSFTPFQGPAHIMPSSGEQHGAATGCSPARA